MLPAAGEVRYLKLDPGRRRPERGQAAQGRRSGGTADGRRAARRRPSQRPAPASAAEAAPPDARQPPSRQATTAAQAATPPAAQPPPPQAPARRRPRPPHRRGSRRVRLARPPDRPPLRPLPPAPRAGHACAPPGSARSRPDSLQERAVTQQVEDLTVPASRGTITDRHGVELAVSEEATTVFANPFLIKNPGRVAAQLAPLLGRDPSELLPAAVGQEDGLRLPAAQAGPDARREGRASCGSRASARSPSRAAPTRRARSPGQLLGTVGTDNNGLSGIEQQYEQELHGTDGKRRLVKDATGEPVSLVDTERAEARQGPEADDRRRAPGARRGRARPGGPRPQPQGRDRARDGPAQRRAAGAGQLAARGRQRPGAAPTDARQNRAVGSTYEPGSTFKAFTVAGRAARRLITPEHQVRPAAADPGGRPHDQGGARRAAR